MPRMEVALITREGEAKVINAARPAALIAFSKQFDGKLAPSTVEEMAWLTHKALEIAEPLDEWVSTLETIGTNDSDIALARAIIGGDEDARRMALGELPLDDKYERLDEEATEPVEAPAARADPTANGQPSEVPGEVTSLA